MKILTHGRLIVILIALLVLSACSSPSSKAVITDATPIPSHRINTHIVTRGETLYAIAWRYDLDYRDLARANGLGSSFRIVPGQALMLTRESTQGSDYSAPAPRSSSQKQPAAQAPSRSINQTSAQNSAPSVAAADSTVNWQWPLRGEVLVPFGGDNGLNKGIDIRGNLGEPVLAAGAGQVVYAGSGLRGYGNLLIVKHSETYLSAYAHNRVLLVEEGDQVSAGKKIAEVGSSGTNSTKLHFEIRFDGQPVDPLRYLPKN